MSSISLIDLTDLDKQTGYCLRALLKVLPPPSLRPMLVLTSSGVLIGGVLGCLLHPRPKKEEEKAEYILSPLLPNLINQDPPSLKDPSVEALWVPDKVEGQKYEEDHRMFIIKDPAAWELKKPFEERKIGTSKSKVRKKEKQK